jgi:hypothetical protein
MKQLWILIKGIVKIILVLVAILLFFSVVFLSMVFFSSPEQYVQVVEKGFIQATGQNIQVKGGVEFKPTKTLNTTFRNSTLTIESKAGIIIASAARLYMTVPWNVMFTQDVKFDTVEGQNIKVKVVKNDKTEREFNIIALSSNIEKDCCELKLNNITLLSKEGEASGALTVKLTEPVLKVSGTMTSQKWTLDKDLDQALKTYTFKGVNDVEGEIKFHIETLVLPKEQLKNVEAVLDLKAKTLKVISTGK